MGKINVGSGKKPVGTAIAADVLAGKTFSNDVGIGLIGTSNPSLSTARADYLNIASIMEPNEYALPEGGYVSFDGSVTGKITKRIYGVGGGLISTTDIMTGTFTVLEVMAYAYNKIFIRFNNSAGESYGIRDWDGNLIATVANTGHGPYVMGIFDDNSYIMCPFNANYVQRFSAGGTLLNDWTGTTLPVTFGTTNRSFKRAGSGYIVFVNTGYGYPQMFTYNTSGLTQFRYVAENLRND